MGQEVAELSLELTQLQQQAVRAVLLAYLKLAVAVRLRAWTLLHVSLQGQRSLVVTAEELAVLPFLVARVRLFLGRALRVERRLLESR